MRFRKDSINIYRRPAPDIVLDFCNEYGIEPKGHCLVWNWFVPHWLQKYDIEQRKAILERRFKEISEEYADKIPAFDIVNESATNYYYGEKTLFPEYDEYGLDLGEKYFPNNEKILNETNGAIWESFLCGKYNPFEFQIKELLSKNKCFDSIGIQYHMFATEESFNDEGYLKKYLNPKIHFEILERLSSYGKSLHISEITIPSMFETSPENEAIQAELLEKLYSLWFSIENMKGIVWWNLIYGYAAFCARNSNEGENRHGGGLLHYDTSEKPAYRVLDELVNHRWKTNFECECTDSLSFRGFYGKYEIAVDVDGKTKTFDVDFSKNCSSAVFL